MTLRALRMHLRILFSFMLVLAVGAVVSGSAQAQTICNSQLVIGFPNGDNLNRVIGQTVRMSLTLTNGPSENGGAPDNQTFTLVDFFPSCTSVSGGVCTIDEGENAGAPPPIQYMGNLATSNCPSLPTADTSNPFDVKFSLAPPYDFTNGTSCTFSFDVKVIERGNLASTPANIAQLANMDGNCDSTLTSSASGTSAITLTCPVCDDGNVCNGMETCNAATAQCMSGTPLTCNDNNACTTDTCSPTAGCVFTANPPSACDDQNACTNDSCAPATGCVHTPITCDDQNSCTTDTCSPATGCAHTPISCDDQNSCTTDTCAPATGCVHTALSCDDSNACTDDTCSPAAGCVHTPVSPSTCDDHNACTTDACVPATGCTHTPISPQTCDDNNACTTDTCAPATGCVHTPMTCNDNNACTDDTCSPATGCVYTPKPPDFCNDNNACTDDACVPATGCVHTTPNPPNPACTATICRTPGFWGTHAGTEKGGHSVNIAEAVIDCVDGNCADHTANDFLLVCGQKIDSPDTNPADGTTDVNDAASSTEALCVPVQGDQILQLARQLTAAALNCVISGGGADCSKTPLYSEVFTDCNNKCLVGASKDALTACISQLDCLNNGGSFNNGACSGGGTDNCHQRLLVNESLGLNFEPPGPAGSSNACNAAHDTACTVVGPGQSQCGTDSLP